MVTAVVVFVLLLSSVGAEITATCSNGSEKKLAVNKTADGVQGRYTVQYCSPVDANLSGWEFIMSILNKPREQCDGPVFRHKTKHSHFTVDVHSQNCTHMCFTQQLDLMYTSCYEISNQLISGNIRSTHDNDYIYLLNNISGPDYYNERSHIVKDFDLETSVAFNWYPGRIPITDYKLELCGNETHSESCMEVSNNCTNASVTGLRCEFTLPPACYKLHLRHSAPWTDGFLGPYAYVHASFCHEAGVEVLHEEGVPARVWWSCGAAAALAAAVLLALLAYHSRLARRLRDRVRDHWRTSGMSETDTVSGAKAARAEAGADNVRILLLYARDCPAATRALHALRALLELAAPGQVYDLYSPSAVSAAAGAPGEWVRAALLAPNVRVVLLQTPALRYLHDTPLADDQLKLAAPLLPRRVMYGEPHPGDSLLQYALRLLGETHALHTAPYHKYYIATLSALPAEMFRCVVPYRRYELPAAAELLARDLAPAPLHADHMRAPLAALAAAAHEFEAFVRANPDYLMRELVFLP